MKYTTWGEFAELHRLENDLYWSDMNLIMQYFVDLNIDRPPTNPENFSNTRLSIYVFSNYEEDT